MPIRFVRSSRRVILGMAFATMIGSAAGHEAPLPAGMTEDGRDAVTICRSETHLSHTLAARVLEAAYERLGVHSHFFSLPTLRSLALADAGICDGEAARIAGIGREYPNLRRVPTPILHITARTYSRTGRITARRTADLDGLVVGIVGGELYAERLMADADPLRAKTYRQLMTLLARGRIDVAIGLEHEAQLVLDRLSLGTDIRAAGPPVFQAHLFHYLNVAHADLIAPLDAELAAMLDDGRMAAIHRRTLAGLMSSTVSVTPELALMPGH